MPTERRGGKRQGKPGGQYANRKDMQQAPRAAPGQTYGEAGKQLAAQQQVPLSAGAAPAPGSSQSVSALAGRMGGGGGQAIPSLTDPSTRPGEPITSGLPTGPGPGPDALGLPDAGSAEDDNMLAWLQAAFRQYPSNDIARVIAALETRVRQNSRVRPPKPQGQSDQPGNPVGRAMGWVGEQFSGPTGGPGYPSVGVES